MVEMEGNFNKNAAHLRIKKLSEVMNEKKIHSKFIQTGENQEKYLLQPVISNSDYGDLPKNHHKKMKAQRK